MSSKISNLKNKKSIDNWIKSCYYINTRLNEGFNLNGPGGQEVQMSVYILKRDFLEGMKFVNCGGKIEWYEDHIVLFESGNTLTHITYEEPRDNGHYELSIRQGDNDDEWVINIYQSSRNSNNKSTIEEWEYFSKGGETENPFWFLQSFYINGEPQKIIMNV